MIAIMLPELVDCLDALPSEERRHPAGALVFRRDSTVEWLHQVEDGAVQLLRYGADGSATVLQTAGPGYFLAEASLFSDSYHCDAVALSDCLLVRYRKAAVLAALRTDPGFASAWAQYLSHEVQRTRARAEMLALRRLVDRLNAWLDANGGELPARGQWVGLARDIGVTPEALYRHLARQRQRTHGKVVNR